jgi:hypothetical protein
MLCSCSKSIRSVFNRFSAASARLAVDHKIVSHFGCYHDFIALFRKRLRNQLLAQSVPVSVGRVEKRDSEIERLMHERDRLAFREISPPAGGNGPEPKADFAYGEVGVFVRPEAHVRSA